MLIFENAPGRVSVFRDSADIPLEIRVDGWTGFDGMRSIITEATIAQAGGVQFLHSFSDLIHVYAFGDRIGEIRVSGLAFPGACGDGGASPGGLERVLAFYRANRVGQRATPCQLQMGSSQEGHFQGYLTAFRADVFRPENRLVQFGLTYHAPPDIET